MAKLTKGKLERILTNRLALVDPDFRLEKAGNRIVGNIVSAVFGGKRDHERQKMIWDALQAELGADSVLQVGLLLAFTPEEWNLGAEVKQRSGSKKAG